MLIAARIANLAVQLRERHPEGVPLSYFLSVCSVGPAEAIGSQEVDTAEASAVWLTWRCESALWSLEFLNSPLCS